MHEPYAVTMIRSAYYRDAWLIPRFADVKLLDEVTATRLNIASAIGEFFPLGMNESYPRSVNVTVTSARDLSRSNQRFVRCTFV